MLASALLLFLAPTSAPQRSPQILQPATYRSPSGAVELHVDPSERSGSGPATYRLTRESREVWSGERPFTLWEAAVTDEGRVAGYAYTNGFEDPRCEGSFVVALLSPSGEVLLHEETPREMARFLHTAPDPKAGGLFVQEELDRFAVRVLDPDVNRMDEEWRVYRLSTGELLERIHPKAFLRRREGLRMSLGARPIRGTPLVLEQWWQWDGRIGTRFALVDAGWRPVWELDLPQDYEIPGDEAAEDRLMDRIRPDGAILSTETVRQFELELVAEGRRATFGVREDAKSETGWTVLEVASEPVAAAEPAPAEAAHEQVVLARIGETWLDAGSEGEASVRDVLTFAFHGSGRIEFVRGEARREELTCVLLDESGGIARERAFRLPVEEESWAAAWTLLEDGHWLFLASGYGEQGRARAWLADPASGSLRSIEGFDCPPVKAVTPVRGGGFVVLSALHERYGISEHLTCFGAGGEPQWSVGESLEDPTELFSPQDVAVTPDGRVVVVETIKNRLQVFSPSGAFLDTIELEPAWGQKPRYPSGIAADLAGVLVRDPQGDPRLWRMDLDGTVRGRLTPRYADGRTSPDLARCCIVAPDGRLWTTDGHSFLRLDPDGAADLVIGPPPEQDELAEPATVLIDVLGRICVQDRCTGAVHVFSADGSRMHVCRLEPADVDQVGFLVKLAASPDGSVYVPRSPHRDYLRFGPDGERAETVALGSGQMVFPPRPGGRWSIGYEKVEWIGDDGTTKRTLGRTPTGAWIRHPADLAFTPDGSPVVLDTPAARDQGEVVLAIYSPEGEPRKAFAVPGASKSGWRLACGAEWATLWGSRGRLLLVRLEDGRVLESQLDIAPGGSIADAASSPGGEELWVVETPGLVLERYRFPE